MRLQGGVLFLIGDWTLKMSVRHWLNDGLMALFFFVLGLEFKREILVGEPRDPRQSLPMLAEVIGSALLQDGISWRG